MVGRVLSLGVALGLCALASLGLSSLSAAQAAYPSGSAYATQAKRPSFRPAHRATTAATAAQWRTQAAPPRMHAAAATVNRRAALVLPGRRAQQPLFVDGRAGARKAVPVTRGQDLGLRFRPDERESPYGQPAASQDGQMPGAYQADPQSQFRPTRQRRRATYEELQAQQQTLPPQSPAAPVMPMPMMVPPLMPGFGGYWPNP